MRRPDRRPADEHTAAAWHDGGVTASMTPHGQPPERPWHQPPAGGGAPEYPEEPGPGLRTDVRRAALVAVCVTAAGVLLGLLWLWLAPRVPLVSDGKAVYFKNADGVFVLLGLGFGALTAVVAFWLYRRGGVALVLGTAVGGLLASVVAWQLGIRLGPSQDVVAHARAVGKGAVFDAPLQLRATGALLVWPIAAMAVQLVLTGLFGPRDPLPPEQS
jgi:hypothetical protein